MKILHICMAQYSDGWTYQENMLAKYHVKSGNHVVMLTSEYHYNNGELVKDCKKDFIDCNGVHVKRLPIVRAGLLGKIPRYKDFYDALCNEKPDVIFSHGCQYWDILNIKKYLKIHNNCRLFVDNHADFSNSATTFLSKYILHRMIWRFCANQIEPYTQKFYGVLPARVDFLINEYKLPIEKVKLLVMGADDDMVEKAAMPNVKKSVREKHNINAEDFLIVTGGKIDKAKTQTVLLMEAIMRIDNPKVRLLIFGSVSPELQEQVNTLADGVKIQYIGWIEANESYDYFAASDLVVFPGRHSVFWEQAAGQGIPLICKRWVGTEHVDCGGNVLFLDHDSVNDIYNAISEAMKNYIHMKEIALDKAKRVFSYVRIAHDSISERAE